MWEGTKPEDGRKLGRKDLNVDAGLVGSVCRCFCAFGGCDAYV